MPGARNSASIPTTKGLDADAPFLVESYQHGTDGSTNGQLPSYTYTTDPNSEPQARQPRSWDEASRAKPNPIQPKPKHDAGHVYLNVDSNDSELDVHGGPSDPPAPTNTTITGYATALGWELSKLCALPYIFPPFTSAIVLIWETQNVRARLTLGPCSLPWIPISSCERSSHWRVFCTSCLPRMAHIGMALGSLSPAWILVFWVCR